MEKLTVVKIGGGVLEKPKEMEGFLNQFVTIEGKKILIHGGGKEATRIAEKLGIPTKIIDGRRITDAETLDVATMVYGGLINKRTVAALQSRGCNAIGLTGADAGLITAKKRPIKDIDYGFVGDVEKVNSSMLEQLLELGLMPIIAPLTYDSNGSILNTNADTIASEVAISLSNSYKVSLVFCFEKAGVLADPNNDNTVIERIDLATYAELKGIGIITDGMIPKLDNCFNALNKGVNEVQITNGLGFKYKSGTKLLLNAN